MINMINIMRVKMINIMINTLDQLHLKNNYLIKCECLIFKLMRRVAVQADYKILAIYALCF